MTPPASAAASAAPAAASAGFATTAARLFDAGRALLPELEQGRAIDAKALRAAMESAFGASDAGGAWDWKSAYDACEAAEILFLRRFGAAIVARAPGSALAMIERLAGLLPTHTRRSETSQALQQFSTPAGLAFVASAAAAIRPGELVLEPSAGTGMLAIHAELAGARLALNELADARAELAARLFQDITVTRHDAAQIHDRLDPDLIPGVMLMNPPFSAVANVDKTVKDAAMRHIGSALTRLAPGGRLVAITGASCGPEMPQWTDAFVRLQERGHILFSATIDGRVYARHGTSIATRLTVIDRVPADDPTQMPPVLAQAADTAALLELVQAHVPPRPTPPASDVAGPLPVAARIPRVRSQRPSKPATSTATPAPSEPQGDPLEYMLVDAAPDEAGRLSDAIYEPYRLQSIAIPGAKPHPTPLVQSAAMASVAPPRPSYRPHLPPALVTLGILSDAQLESVIYAGEAHAGFISGAWTVDETFDTVSAAPDDAENAVHFRRGWFLGDGTGAGKGRQVAGILLDNWLKGRRRALWISKSDKLLEDSQRDWSALGQERLLVTPFVPRQHLWHRFEVVI